MPLAGKRIVITRPRAQAATLAEKLSALGAQPILFPTIEIAPMADDAPLQAALRRLAEYHWIVFTSANAVAVFTRQADGRGVQLNAPTPDAMGRGVQLNAPPPDNRSMAVEAHGFQTQRDAPRLAAVGPATARALESRGLSAAFIPDEYVAEALAAGLDDVAGRRVLLPHAELAREALADDLRRRGAIVDEIAVYRTLPAAPDPAGLAELKRGVDAITFTSASAARNFARLLAGEAPSGAAIMACIGPVTAAAAREAGLPVTVVAAEYTLDGLVAALAEHWR